MPAHKVGGNSTAGFQFYILHFNFGWSIWPVPKIWRTPSTMASRGNFWLTLEQDAGCSSKKKIRMLLYGRILNLLEQREHGSFRSYSTSRSKVGGNYSRISVLHFAPQLRPNFGWCIWPVPKIWRTPNTIASRGDFWLVLGQDADYSSKKKPNVILRQDSANILNLSEQIIKSKIFDSR